MAAQFMGFSGTGNFNTAVGDMFHVAIPDTVGDAAFSHWQCSGDPQFNNDTSSALAITYSCGSIYNDTLTAVYAPLHPDTFAFESMDNVHLNITGNNVVIDTIDANDYIVKGNTESYVWVEIIADTEYTLDTIKYNAVESFVVSIKEYIAHTDYGEKFILSPTTTYTRQILNCSAYRFW